MSTGTGRVRRVAGVLAGVVAAVVLGAAPALAHDALVGTTPADGSTADVAPDQVVLTLAEPAVALGTQVLVTGPDGRDMAAGDAQLVGSTVVQPLAAVRPAGGYRVDWRVTSDDGHPVTGTFAFTARAATAPSPPAATSSPAVAAVASPAVTRLQSPQGVVVDDSLPTPASGSGSSAVVLVLVLVVLALVVVRVGRARSLRHMTTTGRATPAGPAGPAAPPPGGSGPAA